MIAAAAINAMGGSARPADFFSSLSESRQPQTPEAQIEALTFLAGIYRTGE